MKHFPGKGLCALSCFALLGKATAYGALKKIYFRPVCTLPKSINLWMNGKIIWVNIEYKQAKMGVKNRRRKGAERAILSAYLLSILNSVRLFSCLPSSVSLVAMGTDSPYPLASSKS